ncbi:MAG: Tn3 family transposase [Cyanobacteria bacterium P01_D01_bin.105]
MEPFRVKTTSQHGCGSLFQTNDREELRKRIKYNHLVANCVVLYNVFEMSRILNRLDQEGHHIDPATTRSGLISCLSSGGVKAYPPGSRLAINA